MSSCDNWESEPSTVLFLKFMVSDSGRGLIHEAFSEKGEQASYRGLEPGFTYIIDGSSHLPSDAETRMNGNNRCIAAPAVFPTKVLL